MISWLEGLHFVQIGDIMALLCAARTEDDLSAGFCCHDFCCARCAQIGDIMARLCAARTEDEARGGGAADARRWTALRSPVESRAMLKTVFRAAADHAAQVGTLVLCSSVQCRRRRSVMV